MPPPPSYHQLYSPLKCKLVLSTTAIVAYHIYIYINIYHHYHHFPNINPPLSFSPFGPPRKKTYYNIYIRTYSQTKSIRKEVYLHRINTDDAVSKKNSFPVSFFWLYILVDISELAPHACAKTMAFQRAAHQCPALPTKVRSVGSTLTWYKIKVE